MIKFLLFVFAIITSITSAYAYIDPGTGGYLISTIWGSIVGVTALVFGIIVRFFRYTLKAWFLKFYNNKQLFYSIAFVVLSTSTILGYVIYQDVTKSPLDTIDDFDPSQIGANYINPERSFGGYNLYNGILIDMEGNEVQRWNYSYLSILDEDGYYYAQRGYETAEWGKFTWDDEPVWIKDEEPIHHDIYLPGDGTVITMTKEVQPYQDRPVEFDVIVVYNKTSGEELDRWSTWDALEELQSYHRQLELDKPPSGILKENHWKNTSIWGGNHDYYHLNSITVVPENSLQNFHSAFKPGNWIISFRHGSMVFIIDHETKEVQWRAIYDQIEGNLEGQHAPFMLPNGNIMIFDNGRYRYKSRIIEVNPVSLDIVWEYKEDDFFTYSQGYAQLLGNNNLLITESESGRVYETTLDKEMVWEFYNPEKTEIEKEDKTTHSEIYRMYRYSQEFIDNIREKWE